MKKIYLLCLLLGFLGCSGRPVGFRFLEGDCIKEVNTQYRSEQKMSYPLYKIESISDEFIEVSRRYQNSWLFLGDRSLEYFNNRGIFRYDLADCPDGKKRRGIASKVKSIAL